MTSTGCPYCKASVHISESVAINSGLLHNIPGKTHVIYLKLDHAEYNDLCYKLQFVSKIFIKSSYRWSSIWSKTTYSCRVSSKYSRQVITGNTQSTITCLPWANETCFAVPHASSLAYFVYICIIVSLLHNLYYSHIRAS